MVDFLLETDPAIYQPHVTYQNGEKILYCVALKAIYGMLTSALLFYKQWRNDLLSQEYKMNPYDPCVANKVINGKQQTIVWHVDDLKVSHIDSKVNDDFIKWVDELYGDDEIGRVKATRGLKHDYLRMLLDYTMKGKIKIDMKYYVSTMIKQYNTQINTRYKTPAGENLFKINPKSKPLGKTEAEEFHTTVARALFVSKRARPDIQTTIAFLCTRVRQPTEEDANKLHRLMSYLLNTKDDVLVLSADGRDEIKWWVDAAFAVHPDMRSHTGAIMTMGAGAAQLASTKQKINTRSSTESELVATDDIIGQVLWTHHFLEEQGYPITKSSIYQDNKSAILLEKNGRASAGKCSRHMNIKYFYITNQVKSGKVAIECCPTD